MKPDHEAAKMVAERLESDPAYRVMVKPAKLGTLAACYLDAMARLAQAEKERGDLLGRARDMLCDGWTEIEMAAWLSDYRAFLAAERK